MLYLVVGGVGFLLGMWVLFVLIERRRRRSRLDRERAASFARHAATDVDRATRAAREVAAAQATLAAGQAVLEVERKLFDARSVTLTELEQENRLLKRDLLNLDVSVRKARLDHEVHEQVRTEQEKRSNEMAARYLSEAEKWIGESINANNYAVCKQRVLKVIEWCRGVGFDVPAAKELEILGTLKADYELAVRAALEREEQARIKTQIREEQLREREIEKELQALERERAAIQAALAKALADAKDAHSEEVERLKTRLAEAEERGRRAVAQAQLTKAGHIYIISNVGAFGEAVYKIGMTRRLNPHERITELGDASVPFPFDIHMMIACDDAPGLENALHRQFHRHRINKVNPRKEFFRVELNAIHKFVVAQHGEVQYVADAEALQYRQSLDMSDEDQEYIEGVFERAEGGTREVPAED